MRIIAIAHRSNKHKAEDFAPHLDADFSHVMKLYTEEKIRDMYHRSDGGGVVFIMEAKSEKEASNILGDLPLVKLGMLSFDFYGIRSFFREED